MPISCLPAIGNTAGPGHRRCAQHGQRGHLEQRAAARDPRGLRTHLDPAAARAVGHLHEQPPRRLLAGRRDLVVGRAPGPAEDHELDIVERRPAQLQHLAGRALRGPSLRAHDLLHDRALQRRRTARRRRGRAARARPRHARCRAPGRRHREDDERSGEPRLAQWTTPCRLCWCLRGELSGSRDGSRYDARRRRFAPTTWFPRPADPEAHELGDAARGVYVTVPAEGVQPRRMSRPTAAMSSSVRSACCSPSAGMTQLRA